jgi:hypothetical protein
MVMANAPMLAAAAGSFGATVAVKMAIRPPRPVCRSLSRGSDPAVKGVDRQRRPVSIDDLRTDVVYEVSD